MTTWPAMETQKAVYAALSSDAALLALIGGDVADPKVYDAVPDNKAFPYITVEIRPMLDRGNESTEGVELTVVANVWYQGPGRGALQVQTIQKRVDELLHEQDLSITGWAIISFRRAFADVIVDPDNVTRHGVQQFKLLLGENISGT